MSLQIADRVRETTTTSGTGTVNLAGATAGFQTFVAGIGTGNTCHYLLLDGTAWETGVGTVTDGSPDTLSRDTVIASSNAGAKIELSGGETAVLCTLPGSASQIRAAIGITDNGIIDWTSTSSNFNTSGLVTSGALTVNGNTILGDASADTLTINAGTWTIGADYTATRSAGARAAGLSVVLTNNITVSGDAGGTSNIRGVVTNLTYSGGNAASGFSALRAEGAHSGTNTLAEIRANTVRAEVTSSGNATTLTGIAGGVAISGSGNSTTANGFLAIAPSLTSTGAATTLCGFRALNQGHATLVTNAISYLAENNTSAVTLTASFKSEQNSGTGAWGFLHTGTANNTFNGATRFGSTTAPINTVDITGSLGRGAPVTKTGDFILAATENWVINNKSGSTCVVTLPAASSWTGREIMFKNIQAQLLNSASSNVVPLAGGAAGTAILSANTGRWATLVSDGTNWVIMQGVI
jgi:hypothetical protein